MLLDVICRLMDGHFVTKLEKECWITEKSRFEVELKKLKSGPRIKQSNILDGTHLRFS